MKLTNIESSDVISVEYILTHCDINSTIFDLYTGKYWNYSPSSLTWYEDIGGTNKLGIPRDDDYVLAKPNGSFTWIANGGLSGVVNSLLPELSRDGIAGTITIPPLTIQTYDNPNFLGNPFRCDTPETTLEVPSGGGAYYVSFKYEGVPIIYLESNKTLLNMSNIIPLYAISRIDTRIHSVGFNTQGVGLPQKNEIATLNTVPYKISVDGGLSLSEDGSRHIILSGATVYSGTTAVNVLPYNSNLTNNLLTSCYHVDGVWNYSTLYAGDGQYDNVNYDNGTNVVELENNKYKVIWVFRSIGDDKEIFTISSNSQYNNIDSANPAQLPPLPPVVAWHCMLVGRIIVQKSASAGIVQSAFVQTFEAAPITLHNNLSGLQGGLTNQYYHLTLDEYNALISLIQ